MKPEVLAWLGSFDPAAVVQTPGPALRPHTPVVPAYRAGQWLVFPGDNVSSVCAAAPRPQPI